MGPPPVHLVVVHRNRGATAVRTVQRFLEQAGAAGLVLTVTVVDNGSDRTELDVLRHGLPGDVELVVAEANLGFGPGANVGLARWLDSDAAICLLAPHDARPASGTVASLVTQLVAHPAAGLACADVGDGRVPRVQPWLGPIDGAPDVDPGTPPLPRPQPTPARASLAEYGVGRTTGRLVRLPPRCGAQMQRSRATAARRAPPS